MFAKFTPIIQNDPHDIVSYYKEHGLELPDNPLFKDYIEEAIPKEETNSNTFKYNKDFFNVAWNGGPKKINTNSPNVKPPYKGKFSITIGAKNSIADRHNNPGNLIYAKQQGATPGEYKKKRDKNGNLVDSKVRWAKFNTIEEGWEALLRQINLDKSRDYTLKTFVNKYAPNFENDTTSYINNIVDSLKIKKEEKIKNIPTFNLAKIIAQIESSTKVKPNY